MHNSRFRALMAYMVVVSLLAASGVAGDLPVEGGLSESVSVSYVLVPFVVFGERGRPVTWLGARDVELFVDGEPVRTDMFERAAKTPVSFTILLDGSGSMALAEKLRGVREAVAALIANRLEGDDYSLHVFASGEVSEVIPFTTDGNQVLAAIDRVEPYGETALFDALLKMPDRSILGNNGSRAIILLTDGLDNASRLTRKELATLFEGVDVPVYPLALRSREALLTQSDHDQRETVINAGVLAGLAGMSGGRMALATERRDLEREIDSILRELRSQYLIGFAPTGKGEVRYRRISLRFVRPVQSVRVRGGYRGTAPPVLAKRN
ncbi:MAG TPA: VWA domain-containing protein [Thermoanaerobaculia bacterium]|nr:VWA domain-containing protein [Thermoanaerobaculia bacterium]